MANTIYANNQIGAVTPKRATEADRLADRVRNAVSEMGALVGRLSRAVDRISGPVPTGVDATEDPVDINPTHIRSMDISLGHIDDKIARLRAEVDRLENFA